MVDHHRRERTTPALNDKSAIDFPHLGQPAELVQQLRTHGNPIPHPTAWDGLPGDQRAPDVAEQHLEGSLVTGWLGGELVERLRVGVDDGAHLDAPSSLSGRPASEEARGVS